MRSSSSPSSPSSSSSSSPPPPFFLLEEGLELPGSTSMSSIWSCQTFDECNRYRSLLMEGVEKVCDELLSYECFRDGAATPGGCCGPPASPVDGSSGCFSLRALFPTELRAILRGGARSSSPVSAHFYLVLPSELHRLDHSSLLQRAVGPGNMNTYRGTVVWVMPGRRSRMEQDDEDGTTTGRCGGGYVRNSAVEDSIVSLDSTVENSTVLNSYVGPRTRVVSSRIGAWIVDDQEGGNALAPRCDPPPPPLVPPSQHLTVRVGAESGGGRLLRLGCDCTLQEVGDQLVRGCGGASSSDGSSHGSIEEKKGATSARVARSTRRTTLTIANYLGADCCITNAPSVGRVLLYPKSVLEGPTQVMNATLYPGARISHASIARNVLMQWNCQVIDSSCVSDSVLMEHAVAGPHSTIMGSVMGPDAHCSEGEIHASVLGPNIAAHHQSLVISALWLAGRGNVGYGANVGSNHTGRAPDQEVHAGEGVFWGLGVVVKFPISIAPYCVVAAGTQLAPQRITLPFSLVVTSEASSSHTATASLLPGWVLASSPYTVARAIIKVQTRRKATRHDTGWDVWRPGLVRQCVEARSSLMLPDRRDKPNKQQLYTSRDVPGLGACGMTDKARRVGIEAYTSCIQRYALRGLLAFFLEASATRMHHHESSWHDLLSQEFSTVGEEADQKWSQLPEQNHDGGIPWEIFPWQEDTLQFWSYQKYLLREEFPLPPGGNITLWTSSLLARLVALEEDYAKQVHDCKRRDDDRGHRTIPGYASSHVMAGKDPVVVQVRRETAETIDKANRALLQIEILSKNRNSKL